MTSLPGTKKSSEHPRLAGSEDLTLAAPDAPLAASVAATVQLVEVLENYLDDLRAGKAPPREQLLAAHPGIAEQLEACLAGLDFIHRAESVVPSAPARLGDFRIGREIGRGGMGAVYEAEQISLNRRVALKILRFGAVADREALDRFQREAETVARLHHTNIVPIFSVGSENGVHYYAMQYIEGCSLADRLPAGDKRIEARRIAQWGLQAAEALAHAHQRGVIHRDVKPSNLLLDREDRIWLTDFGLAKRLDDVTLSMTGVLLGTPRYMSPEQASATAQPVDHRTDIYSLGATLYELATGKPVFAGDSPHNVISLILTREPTPPRQHRPSLPRDLETILLKCLSKNPRERYATADDLADDLRAFLDERPIRARRISIWERSVRWWRRQQRSVTQAVYAVATTILLLIGGLIGYYAYGAWQRSHLRLVTDTPPLVAELLNQQTQQLISRSTLPLPDSLPLPSGRYQVRLQGDRRLSTTYDVDVMRGSEHQFSVNLDDQLLFPELKVPRSFDTLRLGSRADLLIYADDYVGRVDGRSGMLISNISVDPNQQESLRSLPGFAWPFGTRSYGAGRLTLHPHTIEPAPDVDKDGQPDLVLAGRHQAWLMAISGATHRVLWIRGLVDSLAAANGESTSPRDSGVLARPLTIDDFTGDGVPEFVLSVVELHPAANNQRAADRFLLAVSGADGQVLWRVTLDEAWFALAAGQAVPEVFRYANSSGYGYSSTGMATSFSGTNLRRRPSVANTTGYYASVQDAPHPLPSGTVALMAGDQLLIVDAKSGEISEQHALPMRGELPLRWTDVDGDAVPEAILLENTTPAVQSDTVRVKLGVYSLKSRKLLWTRNLQVFWPERRNWHLPVADWPWLHDVDGDAIDELLLPTHSSQADKQSYDAAPWGQLELVKAATGETVWKRALRTIDQQIDFATIGPDIDGDRHRDVFAATIWGTQNELYVDALSGKDGRSLWLNRQRLALDRNVERDDYVVARLGWWSHSSDDWPQLLVMASHPGEAQASDFVGLIAAGTGRWTRTTRGATGVEFADLDGDGNAELMLYTADHADQPYGSGGTLVAVHGARRERWRRLDRRLEASADLDGDGTLDLVEYAPQRVRVAISGATGERLWTIRTPGMWDLTLRPAADSTRLLHHISGADPSNAVVPGDLDRDGIADLLAHPESPVSSNVGFPFLYAISGRSGRVLWESELQATTVARLHTLVLRDLDADGQEELVCLAVLDVSAEHSVASNSSGFHEERALSCIVLTLDGQLVWQRQLSSSDRSGTTQEVLHAAAGSCTLAFADCNADSVTDVIVPADLERSESWSMTPLSGSDGTSLWRRPISSAPGLSSYVAPLAADLDQDGIQELVTVEFETAAGESGVTRHVARIDCLRARTGESQWSTTIDVPPTCGKLEHAAPSELACRPAPRLLERARRPGLISLNCWASNDPGKLVVLNHQGQVVSERRVKNEPAPLLAWASDVDRDGTDELLFVSDGQLAAYDPVDLSTALWKRPLPSGQGRIIDSVPRPTESPVLVLGGGPFEVWLDGIDAATGERLWSCHGPIPRTNQISRILPEQLALLSDASTAPLVYFKSQDVAVAREAIREVAALPIAPHPVTIVAVEDPRMARPLPWVANFAHPMSPRLLRFAVWGSVYCLFLVALPAGYLRYLFKPGRWALRSFLILPVVISLMAITILWNGPEGEFQGVRPKVGLALLAAPAVLYVYRVLTALWQRRRQLVITWLAMTLAISMLFAGLLLWLSQTQYQGALAVGERYSWEGWYWILILGAYYTGWLMAAVVLLRMTGRITVRGWRRLRGSRAGRSSAGAAT